MLGNHSKVTQESKVTFVRNISSYMKIHFKEDIATFSYTFFACY